MQDMSVVLSFLGYTISQASFCYSTEPNELPVLSFKKKKFECIVECLLVVAMVLTADLRN